jgi:hypothetical protein
VPREVAARLASLRRAGVDLERRLRGDPLSAPDSEEYWRGQLSGWRQSVEELLPSFPFQLRSFQQPVAHPADESWNAQVLTELAELRTRLDSIVERLAAED